MTTVYDLLTSLYGEDQYFRAFREKFPKTFKFSKQVKVIPWKKEFEVADRNPEAIDAVEELEKALEKGLITEEEFFEKVKEVYPRDGASKTQAIAFNEKKEVSFREKKPSLFEILHELGHVYFNVTDKVWSSVYSGGESLFWLIITGKVEGNEKTVKSYLKFLKDFDESPQKAQNLLNEAAKNVARKYGIPVKNALGLCLWSGFIPSQKANVAHLDPQELPDELSQVDCWEIVANLIEGTKYGETLWKEYLKELINLVQRRNQLKRSLRIV